MDAFCYRCTAPRERTCDVCKRPVCRQCAFAWPMHKLAMEVGNATCKPCTIAISRRVLNEARAMLEADGWTVEW